MARLQTIRVFLYPGGIVPAEVDVYGHYGQLRQEMRSCGKGCDRCPHGPYWYLVWHEKGTNKAKKRYIGRNLPPVPRELERYRSPAAPRREVEAHGIVMQLLPKGGKYNLRWIQERWEMELRKS